MKDWVCGNPAALGPASTRCPSPLLPPLPAHPWLSLSFSVPLFPWGSPRHDATRLERAERWEQDGDVITAASASILQEAQSRDPGDPNPMQNVEHLPGSCKASWGGKPSEPLQETESQSPSAKITDSEVEWCLREPEEGIGSFEFSECIEN